MPLGLGLIAVFRSYLTHKVKLNAKITYFISVI
jgi:hypothetical protein